MGDEDVPHIESAQELVDARIKVERDNVVKNEQSITASIESLQNDEQRRVLDAVAQLRQCGLESILPLPQLVVCGDQSAGKSSVLEALSGIPFPRSDNLCTRYATEIILRRATIDFLTVKIIPDETRPPSEQASIKAFQETITDFGDLSRVMDVAKKAMDQDTNPNAASTAKAFARDVLSIDIAGPLREQLTLVDIPGLIQTDTKGVTKDDVDLVAEITDRYISQPRTICLAVVSAAYDCANQKILTKVRQVDPKGDRTLGIITKPDLLPSGSGSETAFIELAQNQDIFFKLGWHVLKNRKYDQRDSTLVERNRSEEKYFQTSNFKNLPDNNRGISTLRSRLSDLLFDHIKQELPKLRSELEEKMMIAKKELQVMGKSRASAPECKAYLAQLSLDYYEVCKAAVDGHYEGSYFTTDADRNFDLKTPTTIRRIRAVVQHMNTKFAETHRLNGHKYQINTSGSASPDDACPPTLPNVVSPVSMQKPEALAWVRRVLIRTRGKELVGNFNPLLVGELFWEQCTNWQRLALDYLDDVVEICTRFLDILLEDKCPSDVTSRLRANIVEDVLRARYESALNELDKIMEDVRSYPINYNHYYTDTIKKRRTERQKRSLAKSIENATSTTQHDESDQKHTTTTVNVDQALGAYSQETDPNMEKVSCEEALDCLYAIYKVNQFFHLPTQKATTDHPHPGPTENLRCEHDNPSRRAPHHPRSRKDLLARHRQWPFGHRSPVYRG